MKLNFIKNSSLKIRLAGSILLVAISILSVMFVINFIISRNFMFNNIEQNARNLTTARINELEKILKPLEKIPAGIAAFLESEDISREDIYTIIPRFLAANDDVYGICIAFEPVKKGDKATLDAPYFFKDKGSINDLNVKDSYDYTIWDWYQIPKMMNKAMWSEPYFDEGAGDVLMLTYSVPWYKEVNGNKILQGIVTVDLALDKLQKIVSSTKILDDGYAFLISKKGTFLTYKNSDVLLHQTIFSIADEYQKPEYREIGKKMIAGESGFADIDEFDTGENFRLFYAPVKVNSWSMGLMIPKDELFADVSELNFLLYFIGLVGIGLLTFFTFMITSRLTKPLKLVSTIASEVASGNIKSAKSSIIELTESNKQIDLMMNIDKNQIKDETVLLLRSFYIMLEGLDSLTQRVRLAVIQIVSSNNVINSSVKELEEAITTQAASTGEVTASANEINNNVNSLSVSVNKFSDNIVNADQLLNEGIEYIEEIRKAMDSIVNLTNSMVNKLNLISRKTSNINKVTSTIAGIADRTNLISLNAAIEAEKAGDFGTGFGVIAREIRRLSDNTSNSLMEIESIVNEVQNSVDDGVTSIKDFSIEAKKSYNYVNSVAEKLSRIIDFNKNLNPEFDEVNSKIQFQLESAGQISDSMIHLSSNAAHLKDTLKEFLSISQKLNEAVVSLRDSVKQFNL
ncbi:MAG: methyl-accepting chemotaxis protein [Ignavibacteriaceae bacterium]|nr:methyl-accepting chemotaxis protein [Ignavibacteriaceae bacterium]